MCVCVCVCVCCVCVCVCVCACVSMSVSVSVYMHVSIYLYICLSECSTCHADTVSFISGECVFFYQLSAQGNSIKTMKGFLLTHVKPDSSDIELDVRVIFPLFAMLCLGWLDLKWLSTDLKLVDGFSCTWHL